MGARPEVITIGETMVAVNPHHGQSFALDVPMVLAPAGAESNVAAGLSLLGHHAAWVSRLSSDPLGHQVSSQLADLGVDTSFVVYDDAARTGVMFKLPQPDHTQVVYYRRGSAATHLSPADIPDLSGVQVVHFSGITAGLSPSCLALCRALVQLPGEVGAGGRPLISFDVNYRPAVWESLAVAAPILLELAKAADVVFVGRDEAEHVWGVATASQVSELLGPLPHVVVKDADIQATEYEAGIPTVVPSRKVEVVEVVGAGDAFVAGWLSAYLAGQDARARLTKGHAMAAVVLQSATDLPADPHNFDLNL